MEQIVPDIPVLLEFEQPKFCNARAIVSMCLGINSLPFALGAIAYCVIGVVMSIAALQGELAFMAPVAARALLFYTVIYGGIAGASGAVAIAQANTFTALYHRQSKMAKAGKVLAVISIVLSVLSIIALVVVQEGVVNLVMGR